MTTTGIRNGHHTEFKIDTTEHEPEALAVNI